MSTVPIAVVSKAARSFLRRGGPRERVLILGTSRLAVELARTLASRRPPGVEIAGVVVETGAGGEAPARLPVVGSLDHLDRVLGIVRPDRIVVALRERRGRLPLRFLLEARVRGVAVEEGAEFYERLTGKTAIESLNPGVLLFPRRSGDCRRHLALQRAASLILSILGLVALAPVFALVALAIKIDSPGPVLFVQERVGLLGRRFRLLKFRTMHPARAATSEWARDNADRITRLGRWLRRFRVDELPQLVNVLRGEMNLIGPRPHPASNLDLFLERIPNYWLRYLVRPGITGWAQVRYGYANDLEEETEKVRYDLYYLARGSPWLDLRILLETLRVVVLGRAAGAVPAPGRREPAAPGPAWSAGSREGALRPLRVPAVPRPGSTIARAGRGGEGARAGWGPLRADSPGAPVRRGP